jgi:hypothetical protein
MFQPASQARRPRIRSNQMHLGVPSAAQLADGCGPFFRAPVPFGWIWIEVEFSDTASSLYADNLLDL